MEEVKMISIIGGEEIFIGSCHPARARILVKKQLASWHDGKVLLHVLDVHSKFLSGDRWSPFMRGPLDDINVSSGEIDRRKAWFEQFMLNTSRVILKDEPCCPHEKPVRGLPSIEEATKWFQDRQDISPKPFVEPIPLTEGETDSYFLEQGEPQEEFSVSWASAPDVSSIFESNGTSQFTIPAKSFNTKAEYEALWSVDKERMLRLKETGLLYADGTESTPFTERVCGTLLQIACWRALEQKSETFQMEPKTVQEELYTSDSDESDSDESDSDESEILGDRIEILGDESEILKSLFDLCDQKEIGTTDT